MFKIKQKSLDHFTGFLFALLAAFPFIRETFGFIPPAAFILPALFLIISGFLKIFSEGNKIFKWNTVIYTYIIFVLFLYLLTSLFWNTHNVDASEDINNILFMFIVIIAVVISFNTEASRYFLNWIVIFGVFSTISYIQYYLSLGSLRGYGIPAYLTRSQIIGMGALISLYKTFFVPGVNKKLYGGITFFLFFGLAISLGRASLLGAIAIALILIIYYYWNNWPKSYSISEWLYNKSSLLLAGSFVGLTIFFATQIERTANRLLRLFTGSEFSTHRVELWISSIYGFIEAPVFGHGLSSSGVVVNFNYPHNLFFQVLLDGGFIAFVMLFIICMYPILKTYIMFRNGFLKTNLWIPLVSCYLFMLFHYCISINFYEGRILLALGLIIVIILEQRTSQKQTSVIKA